MDYEIGVKLDRIEAKIDYMIQKLAPPEKAKERPVEERT